MRASRAERVCAGAGCAACEEPLELGAREPHALRSGDLRRCASPRVCDRWAEASWQASGAPGKPSPSRRLLQSKYKRTIYIYYKRTSLYLLCKSRRLGLGFPGAPLACHEARLHIIAPPSASHRASGCHSKLWLPLQALANQPGARPAAPRLGSVRARVRARVRVGHIAPRLGLLLTRALASHGQSVGIGRCVGCSGRCHSEDSHPCRRPSPGPALQTVRWPTPRSRGRPRDRPRGRRCGGRALANPPGSSLAAPSDWPRLARARPPHRQPRGRSRARWQWLGAQWSGLALGATGCPQPPGAP